MDNILTLKRLFQCSDEDYRQLVGKTFVGIDFGTSTTVVSVATYNPLTLRIECSSLQLPQKDKFGSLMFGELFPTVIAVDQNTGKPLYGQGAYDLKWHPDYTFGVNLWHSFKMELGKDLGPRWYDSLQSTIKSPQDATRIFFKFLRKSIEKAIEEKGISKNIKYAVSIPASFESNQRNDLMSALKANDIDVEGSLFIDEPNAAFIGYINSEETKPIELKESYNPKVLVFDFGAGTCDISLLEITVDHHGLHSNNLSISQFAELGGNDIDRYIASNYLLPQLLKANNLDGNNDRLTTKQKEVVASQLYGIAENMKKRLCETDFNYLLSDPECMDEMVAKGHGITVETPEFAIPTNEGALKIEKLWLSYKDFLDTMKVFFKTPLFGNLGSYTVKERQKRYNSVQAAINTALSKAHVNKEEVDYVIMVGGSSRNPFVQQKIRSIFLDATVMIPRELQALVSQGAALHSLLSHGLCIDAVRPIVGESIVVMSQTGQVPVVVAGTEVPFKHELEGIFSTGEREYSEIEIPVCVGSDKKMLYNLRLTRAGEQSFPKLTPVSLSFEMDSDKILKVRARCLGEEWEAKCENPLDNFCLTDGEAKVLKAQRAAYISADTNGQRPTAQALENLSKAYEENGQSFLAAETLEERIQYYPQPSLYNRIGVLFHNGENYNRAIAYLRMAQREAPDNARINCHLGHCLYIIGENDEARKYLEKSIELKGDYAIPMITLGRLEENESNPEKAKEYFQRAFNILNRRWQSNNLNDVEKGWFITAAGKVHNEEVASQLRKELASTSSKNYTVENTLFTSEKIKKS